MHITKGTHYRGRGAHLRHPAAGEMFVVADDDSSLDTICAILSIPPINHAHNQTVIIVSPATFAEPAKKEGA